MSTYKYLGCMVDDSLGCSSMVEHRVEMGSQALGAWLRRCRESVGEVVYAVDAVTGGIRVVVWGRDLGLPSEVRWVEPATIKGLENLLWGGCAPPKGIPDDGG